MQYRDFGRTGLKISRLGFGAMRLPEKKIGKKSLVDRDRAVPLMRRAFEEGVNYLDTAWMYNNNDSENAVGEALADGWRDRIILSTKSPGHLVKKPGDYRRILEEQLRKLRTDRIDFYHFHGIGHASLLSTDKASGWIADAARAKEEGLIRHLSFSFHSDPKEIRTLVDMGIFSSMICQYNFLDRSCEEGMAYAKARGLGVVTMGPVGGGRIAEFPEQIRSELNLGVENSAELAFRFVFANPSVDCAISGMNDPVQLEQNLRWAALEEPLTGEEKEGIHRLMERLKKISELYCTSCQYCLPCPAGIGIPSVFGLLIAHDVYGLKEHAKTNYRHYGVWPWAPQVKADACTDCGACEPKCPQKIPIREQLRKAHSLFHGA